MKKILGLLAIMALILSTYACKKGEEKHGEDTAPAQESSIGVPECDEYFSKYSKCIQDKVPEAAREMIESSLSKSMDAWKQAAATDEGKAQLASTCKSALDAAKQGMQSYGCDW